MRTYTQREVDEIVFNTIEACARTLEACAPKYANGGPSCRWAARVVRGRVDPELQDPYLRGLRANQNRE